MKKSVEAALHHISEWTSERQEDAAEFIRLIEEHDHSPYQLTDEQITEVRRRLVSPAKARLTLDQLDERLRILGIRG